MSDLVIRAFAAGDTADVVLIGNSSVNAAFVIDDLEARSGLGTFFNAGLDGSSMRQTGSSWETRSTPRAARNSPAPAWIRSVNSRIDSPPSRPCHRSSG